MVSGENNEGVCDRITKPDTSHQTIRNAINIHLALPACGSIFWIVAAPWHGKTHNFTASVSKLAADDSQYDRWIGQIEHSFISPEMGMREN
jgi:hypothetical protein